MLDYDSCPATGSIGLQGALPSDVMGGLPCLGIATGNVDNSRYNAVAAGCQGGRVRPRSATQATTPRTAVRDQSDLAVLQRWGAWQESDEARVLVGAGADLEKDLRAYALGLVSEDAAVTHSRRLPHPLEADVVFPSTIPHACLQRLPAQVIWLFSTNWGA